MLELILSISIATVLYEMIWFTVQYIYSRRVIKLIYCNLWLKLSKEIDYIRVFFDEYEKLRVVTVKDETELEISNEQHVDRFVALTHHSYLFKRYKVKYDDFLYYPKMSDEKLREFMKNRIHKLVNQFDGFPSYIQFSLEGTYTALTEVSESFSE